MLLFLMAQSQRKEQYNKILSSAGPHASLALYLKRAIFVGGWSRSVEKG